MTAVSGSETGHLVESRLVSALRVADSIGVDVSVDELLDLLPAEGPQTPEELARWLRESWAPGSMMIGLSDGRFPWLYLDSTLERKRRGQQYWHQARRLLDGSLNGARPWLRCLSVTGSAAYGEPDAGDDCDFLAIVRPGGVWLFLAYAYLAVRARRLRGVRDAPSSWCFNWVLDEKAALLEYSRPRGFLFAREALMARPLMGEPYYRALLQSFGWLRDEAPRLFRYWDARSDRSQPTGKESPLSPWLKLLNALVYPWLAAYLHSAGIYRNHRLRRQGRSERGFRVVTRFSRFALVTEHFERLEQMYAGTSASATRS